MSEVYVTGINKNDRLNPKEWIPAAYPPEAMAARVEGVVILEFAIAEDGRVSDTRIVRSTPMLDDAAVAAVRQWEFSAARRFATVLRGTQTIAMRFSLR
jgi:protein TonB